MTAEKFVRNAIVPILVGIAITISVVVSHNDSLARDKQASHAVVVACKSTHDGLSDLVGTVNDLLSHEPDRAAINTKLTASVTKSYKTCLAGVSK